MFKLKSGKKCACSSQVFNCEESKLRCFVPQHDNFCSRLMTIFVPWYDSTTGAFLVDGC